MRIFVSIASYQDPILKYTVESLYNNAKFKDNLVIGVFDQSLETLEFDFHVKYKQCKPEDSNGACWARSIIQMDLLEDEDIFMQIDSHTMFDKDWDEYLINEYNKAKTWIDKPVITGYPRPFEVLKTTNAFNTDEEYVFVPRDKPTNNTQVMKAHIPFTDGLHCSQISDNFSPKQHKGFLLSGGFIFTSRQWVTDVPYDPEIFFIGEESTLALRSYTHGYDMVFVPNTPLYHWYNTDSQEVKRELHWEGINAIKSQGLAETGRTRKDIVLSGVDTGRYGIGNERTLKDYANFSGIDYENKTYAPDKANFKVYENLGWEEEELG